MLPLLVVRKMVDGLEYIIGSNVFNNNVCHCIPFGKKSARSVLRFFSLDRRVKLPCLPKMALVQLPPESHDKNFLCPEEMAVFLKKRDVTFLHKIAFGSYSEVFEGVYDMPIDEQTSATTSHEKTFEGNHTPTASFHPSQTTVKKVPTTGSVQNQQSKEVFTAASAVKTPAIVVNDIAKDSKTKIVFNPTTSAANGSTTIASEVSHATKATKRIKIAVKYVNLNKTLDAYRDKFFPRELKNHYVASVLPE